MRFEWDSAARDDAVTRRGGPLFVAAQVEVRGPGWRVLRYGSETFMISGVHTVQ
jgi:hypothetical protein